MIFGGLFESNKTKAIKAQTAAIKENTEAIKKNINAQKEGINSKESTNIISNVKNLIEQQKSLTVANGNQLTSWKNLKIGISSSVKAIGSFIATNPVTAILGIIGVIATLADVYDRLTVTVEETREKSEELITEYESALKEANNNAKTVEDLSGRYQELSKGVNDLGQNVSLTTEEYEEYNSIVNQIAEMFPNLISGYTEEGNAILNLKGNIEGLRDAYKEAQREAYNLLIASGKDSNGNDIIENFSNQMFGKETFLNARPGTSVIGKSGTIDILEEVLGMTDVSDVQEYFEDLRKTINIGSEDLKNALRSSGINDLIYTRKYENVTNEDFLNIKEKIQAVIQSYELELESALGKVESIANAYLNTNEQYQNLDEETQNAASILVNNLNESIASEFEDTVDVGAYVSKILELIKTNNDFSDALSGLFTLDEELSPTEAKGQLDSYFQTLSYYLGEDKEELKIRLGFENVDELAVRYENLVSQFSDINLDQYFKEHSINTSQELDYWLEITSGAKSAAEAVKMYENAKKDVLSNSTATISDSVSQIAKQLQPQFEQLAEAYQNIFTDEGFTLENVDNNMLEGLRSAFADIEKDLGVDFDTTELNGFFNVLTNGASTAEEVQQAFNDLATSYLYSTDTLENLNDETASAIEQQLEEMGVTNANDVVTAALTYKKQELAVANMYAAETGEALANASAAEIAAFAAEQVELGNLSQEMALLLWQKISVNMTSINTAADIDNLYKLAQAAGATAETLNILSVAKSRFTTNSSGSTFVDSHRAQKDIALGIKDSPELDYQYEPVKINFDGNSIKDAEKAGKEAADKYLEAFEKEYENLNDLLDHGKISEKEYLDQLRKLYQRYFKDKEKYLKEYAKYEDEYLRGMKSLYEDAFSYIGDILDDQIDAYGDQKDAAVDSLEAQRDAAIEAYEAQKEAIEEQIEAAERQKEELQDQIDAKQDEIDAINEAADARQREIDMQKAQYELQRMMSQRTQFIYKDGQMVYQADTSGIRDAQEEIADLEREQQIADIEKEIDLLEKQQDEIDDYIDQLQARQDEIDELIDSTNEYYDELIAQTENYWDGLIQGLEDYKSRWDELADLEEQAKMQMVLEQLGVSTEEILSMSDSAFQNFKNNYLAILSDIYAGNDQMLASIGNMANVDMSGITGYLEQTQAYIDSLNQIDLTTANEAIAATGDAFKQTAESVGLATNAIVGGGAETEESGGGEGESQSSEGSGGGGVSFKQAIDEGTADGVEKIGEISNAFAGDEDGENGTSVTGSIDKVITKVGTPGGEEGGSGGEGEGEDSLTGALQEHIEYATGEEGIPAEQLKFEELKEVVDGLKESLEEIQTILEELSSNTYEIKVDVQGGGGLLSLPGHAKGVKKLKEDELAWTQEKGSEIIVSPTRQAILTPLEKGDSVINDKLTENLFKWGEIDPNKFMPKQNYSVDLKNIPINVKTETSKVPSVSIENVNFTCPGVTGEQVMRQIEGSFKGLFLNAYQQAFTKK